MDMTNKLSAAYAALKTWFNAHPKIKMVAVTAEGAAWGAIANYIDTGHRVPQNRAELYSFAVFVGTAISVAIRNYVREYAKSQSKQ